MLDVNKRDILDPLNSLKLFGLNEYFLDLTKLFKYSNKLLKSVEVNVWFFPASTTPPSR